jgi:hypothetical protein
MHVSMLWRAGRVKPYDEVLDLEPHDGLEKA